ncbi:hypothetical protein ACI2OX_14395 [Bacillus sp. N9]
MFQLYSLRKHHPELLEKAKTFLMIPDYLNFLLTGKKRMNIRMRQRHS